MMVVKKGLILAFSAFMQKQPQSFAALLTRVIFGTLLLFTMLVSSTTKVFPQTDWTKYPGNPVLDMGIHGEWDDQCVFGPCVLFDGSTYHMWYSGYDGANFRIGYATSPDGITWTKHLNNPVLDLGPAGSWDDDRVYFPCVIFDGSTFHMWYTGTDGYYERTGYATSPDGVNWTKYYAGNPVLDLGPAGSWDDITASEGCVLFDGSTYHMWYSGYDGAYFRIGYATSSNEVGWTKYPGNPILDVGPVGSWDRPSVQNPRVVFDGTTFHMWYSGGAVIDWRIGYATSPDETTWTKDTLNNPVLDVGPAGSWDDVSVGLCWVIIDSGTSTYEMWYSGGDEIGEVSIRIGYATSGPPVPVELTSFEAIADQGFIVLNWVTASEIYCHRWEIYRSEQEAGAYGKVGELPGHGSTEVAHTYRWVDRKVHPGVSYFYKLKQVDLDGSFWCSHIVSATASSSVPESFVLYQNCPNPFNPNTDIRYQIPKDCHVTLNVFNTLGQQVRTLMNGHQEAGEYSIMWEGRDDGGKELASGLYFCQLKAGDLRKTIKMLLIK